MLALIAVAASVIMSVTAWAGPVDSSSVAPAVFAVSIHMSWEADATTDAAICTVASGHPCRARRSSDNAGGFSYPSSVAVDPRTGDVLVAELGNHRVQQMTPTGAFVAMFGGDVDLTKDSEAGAAPSERDVCTAASSDVCTAGLSGTGSGLMVNPTSVAVDPVTGDFYVADVGSGDIRVDKYTATGRFVWALGKGVNARTGRDICRASRAVRKEASCRGGRKRAPNSTEAAAFKFAAQHGDLITVGGPERLLYVGDEHRVQEFDSNGAWRRGISLVSLSAAPGSAVTAVAVDRVGDLYVVYQPATSASGSRIEHSDVVRELDRHGVPLTQFTVAPVLPGALAHVDGIALDPLGGIAVIGVEVGEGFYKRFGRLYTVRTGIPVGEFRPPSDDNGLTFDERGDLYVAATDDQEVAAYVPIIASTLSSSPVSCVISPPGDRAADLDCAL